MALFDARPNAAASQPLSWFSWFCCWWFAGKRFHDHHRRHHGSHCCGRSIFSPWRWVVDSFVARVDIMLAIRNAARYHEEEEQWLGHNNYGRWRSCRYWSLVGMFDHDAGWRGSHGRINSCPRISKWNTRELWAASILDDYRRSKKEDMRSWSSIGRERQQWKNQRTTISLLICSWMGFY